MPNRLFYKKGDRIAPISLRWCTVDGREKGGGGRRAGYLFLGENGELGSRKGAQGRGIFLKKLRFSGDEGHAKTGGD